MAVRTVKGRHRSERTQEEEYEILKEELDNLTDDEAVFLKLMIEDLQSARGVEPVRTYTTPDGTTVIDKGKPLYDLISEAEYSKEVISVEEWISDSYFMGKVGFTWPRWRDDLKELFTGGYNEALLTGAIGIGKSTFVEMAYARLIYEYSCLRNPHQTYGLMPNRQIYIAIMNVTEDLAKKVVFSGLISLLEQSPYFEKDFPFESTQKIIRFPNGLRVIPRASMDTSVLGLDVIGAVLSETNSMETVASQKAARAQYASQVRHGIETDVGKTYNELVTRWKSRFGRSSGKIPGLFTIDSSKMEQSDFTETHLIDVKDDPFVFVRDYAMWDVQPPDRFSKKTFKVFVGDEKVRSRIIGPDDDVQPQEGTTQQIIEVPENWRRQAEVNLDGFLRNVAGIATVSIDRLFSSMQGIHDAQQRWKANFENPFHSDVWVTDQKFPIDWGRQATIVNGAWQLKKDPKAHHAIHFDMGYRRDRFGLACGYIAGETKVERAVGGELVLERAPIIVIRWCMALEAPKDSEVTLGIGRAILWSAMKHGLRVRWGSCDQWMSVDTIQMMQARGIDAEQVSVTGEESYLMFRTAAYENRLILPDNKVLYDELKFLLWNKERGIVDHPPGKHNDVADACCGVIDRLTRMFLADEARPLAPMPVVGISQLYNEEEEDPDLWVLETKGRPLEVGELITARKIPGATSAASGNNPPPEKPRKRKFMLR